MRRCICALVAVVLLFSGCALQPVEISRAPIEGPKDLVEVPQKTTGFSLADIGTADKPVPNENQMISLYGQRYARKADLINILLIGVDKDAKRDEIGRSDMLILCSLDPWTAQINFLTIPRDTHAYVYKVDDKGAVTDTVYEKINHAYAYGRGPDLYSAQNAMLCVSRLLSCDGQLDVPIHYYMSLDLDGLADFAAAFGGVEVTLDQSIPGVGTAGETVNLQGPAVRYYLERRHDMKEGEVSRQKHQQTFMFSLLKKIRDQGAVKALPALYVIFTELVKTNLNLRQLGTCALILDKADITDMTDENSKVTFTRIEGEGVTIDGVWYLEPNVEQMRELVLSSQYTPVS